ncbi:MAG: polysaccharide deacetylase family protein [Kiritimatiellae bacterium]|nr:polysaccharide deacetylase family protein [Kiritimatiellia bacterium]MBQ6331058.1 polysaccharide deacetylase family protein [Kiritimatiellia bacterium]
MSDNPSAIALSIEETASSLRRMATSGGRQEIRGKVRELLSAIPRRIRSAPSGRRDLWNAWRSAVLSIDPRKLPFPCGARFRLWRWRLLKLPRAIEALAYYSGTMAVFRRLNRGAKKVLTFHNVMPDALCAFDLTSGVTMSASRFEAMMRRLCRRYRFSADFDDPSTLTVTFDDGYRCQFETAGEILRRLGVPAVVFVSGALRNADRPERALAVDRLLYWASYAPMEALAGFAGAAVSSRAEFWHEFMNPAYRRDAAARGENVFAKADSIWPFAKAVAPLGAETLRLRLAGPDAGRVEQLKAEGWRIGWHTRTHFPLAFLSDADAESELTPDDRSCLDLPMSYPYGEPVAVSRRDEEIAERAGFRGGLSNLAVPGERESRFFMPRITLTGDTIGDESMLSGFRYFLETGRLLRRFGRETKDNGGAADGN